MHDFKIYLIHQLYRFKHPIISYRNGYQPNKRSEKELVVNKNLFTHLFLMYTPPALLDWNWGNLKY